MSSRNDLRDTLRDDERRQRDEVRISTLQSQLDEMRSLVRELVSRQTRNENQFKNYEGGLAELRASLEQHRHEVSQATQARQLEDSRVRDQLTELDERIDETGKPVRAIQAHVAEIIDSIRRGRDDDQDELRRYQELKSLIENLSAQSERNADMAKGLRDQIENVRTDVAQTERDIVKLDDNLRIIEQDARRRISEVAQEITQVDKKYEQFGPMLDQLEAMIDEVRDSVKHIDPALAELAKVDAGIREEITRIYAASQERDDTQSERIDELRVQIDVNARELRQSIEERYERLSERHEGHGDRLRELAYRLSMIDMRLDELGDVHRRLRREFWHLHEMRTRMKMDQVQSELEQVTADRREIEAELIEDPPKSAPPRATNNGDLE